MVDRPYETIIDCDVHQRIKSPEDLFPYLPRAYQEQIREHGLGLPGTGYGGVRPRADSWPESGAVPGSDLAFMRQQHLDVYPIEYAILLGQHLRAVPTHPNADYAAALASAYNDWMIEQWLEQDARLKGAAIIPSQDPRLSAKEIERVGSHPDIVGVLVPNGARIPYGQRFYDPIFDACVNLGLPLLIHTGSEGQGINGCPTGVGCPSYYIEHRQTRATCFQAHLASMVFEGLFERYPTLRVVCVEGGYTWLPTFLWRLNSDWRALRSETPWVKRPPSEYIFENCRFTTQPMELPERQSMLLTIFEWGRAEDVLMFCSDYPHFDFDSPDLSLPPMPEGMRQRVFSENARELFKLPRRQPAVAEPLPAN